MKILIFGLPGSGKTSFVNTLLSRNMAAVRFINADDIRKETDDWDFSREGRERQAERMYKEACKLEEKNIPVLVDFICPYDKYRKNYDVTIWMDTVEKGNYEDTLAEFEIPTDYTERISGFNYSHRDQLNLIQKKYLPHFQKYSNVEFKIDLGSLYLAGIELL
jgi:adenylylsulfate kinase|tara:strand:- start:479 stop:967 length:489 start_codon:yes stop_codon:yes gene_type:complete